MIEKILIWFETGNNFEVLMWRTLLIFQIWMIEKMGSIYS
jgi:hypothetical protein